MRSTPNLQVQRIRPLRKLFFQDFFFFINLVEFMINDECKTGHVLKKDCYWPDVLRPCYKQRQENKSRWIFYEQLEPFLEPHFRAGRECKALFALPILPTLPNRKGSQCSRPTSENLEIYNSVGNILNTGSFSPDSKSNVPHNVPRMVWMVTFSKSAATMYTYSSDNKFSPLPNVPFYI